MPSRIFLVRHGETAWNVEGRYQGWQDIPLSSVGREQAEKLSKALHGIFFSQAISSPLSRAEETARTIVKSSLEVKLDPSFREICHGTWEGKLNQEIREMNPQGLETWLQAPHVFRMPEGESLQDVHSRCVSKFEIILSSLSSGKNLLLVSHDAVIKVLLCHVLGLGLENFWKFKQGSTAINVISVEKNGFALEVLNHLGHLHQIVSEVVHPAL